MRDFKYTSCDNEECKEKKNCKRYVMFKQYGATDIQKGKGDKYGPCRSFLPLKGI